MDIKQMTKKELLELKCQRYKRAVDNGTIEKLYLIARELGKELSATYGPKYSWNKDQIDIYVDDYGHYMTVNINDKLVCSTHFCDEFIIPGEWINIVLKSYQKAFKKNKQRKVNQEDLECKEILKQIV